MEDGKSENDGVADAPRLDAQLCFALYSTSRAITREYGDLLEPLGVTYPQYAALLVLWEADGVPVNSLARALELEPATTTPIVKRLESLGFVERRRNPDDERQVLVFLTEEGRARSSLAGAVPPALGCAMDVDDTEAGRLIARLNRIKERLADSSGLGG